MSHVNRAHCSVICQLSQEICQSVSGKAVTWCAVLQQVRRRRSSSRGALAAYSSSCLRPCLSFFRRRQPLSITSRDSDRGAPAACKQSCCTHAGAHAACSRSTCSLTCAACRGKSDSCDRAFAHSISLSMQQDEGYWWLRAWWMQSSGSVLSAPLLVDSCGRSESRSKQQASDQ